jgi:hypothetical protein
LRAEYTKPEQELPPTMPVRAYRQVLDWILRSRSTGTFEGEGSLLLDPDRRALAIRLLGRLLGSDLYSAYLNGRISKRLLRSLYFRDLSKSGEARTLYLRAMRTAAMGAPQIKLRMVS